MTRHQTPDPRRLFLRNGKWHREGGKKALKGAAFPRLLAVPILVPFPRGPLFLSHCHTNINMSNVDTEKPTPAAEVEAQPASTGGPVYDNDLKVDYDRTGAIDAEKIEHEMTVLQAVKAYPAASWWAFVMSATIVSSCP